jgi:hypothetical protein
MQATKQTHTTRWANEREKKAAEKAALENDPEAAAEKARIKAEKRKMYNANRRAKRKKHNELLKAAGLKAESHQRKTPTTVVVGSAAAGAATDATPRFSKIRDLADKMPPEARYVWPEGVTTDNVVRQSRANGSAMSVRTTAVHFRHMQEHWLYVAAAAVREVPDFDTGHKLRNANLTVAEKGRCLISTYAVPLGGRPKATLPYNVLTREAMDALGITNKQLQLAQLAYAACYGLLPIYETGNDLAHLCGNGALIINRKYATNVAVAAYKRAFPNDDAIDKQSDVFIDAAAAAKLLIEQVKTDNEVFKVQRAKYFQWLNGYADADYVPMFLGPCVNPLHMETTPYIVNFLQRGCVPLVECEHCHQVTAVCDGHGGTGSRCIGEHALEVRYAEQKQHASSSAASSAVALAANALNTAAAAFEVMVRTYSADRIDSCSDDGGGGDDDDDDDDNVETD